MYVNIKTIYRKKHQKTLEIVFNNVPSYPTRKFRETYQVIIDRI